jgi:hypothetical protein
MENRIKNYLSTRTFNPLKISKKMGITIGDVIPVTEAQAIISMIIKGSMENYLNQYDRFASESDLSQKICFSCKTPMLKQPEYSFRKPTNEMIHHSIRKFTAWRWKCPGCNHQSEVFKTNCL